MIFGEPSGGGGGGFAGGASLRAALRAAACACLALSPSARAVFCTARWRCAAAVTLWRTAAALFAPNRNAKKPSVAAMVVAGFIVSPEVLPQALLRRAPSRFGDRKS